jgi:hypothetical protein
MSLLINSEMFRGLVGVCFVLFTVCFINKQDDIAKSCFVVFLRIIITTERIISITQHNHVHCSLNNFKANIKYAYTNVYFQLFFTIFIFMKAILKY